MSVDAIVGLQRGDEGKGRFTDMLMTDYDIGARFNGGNNAGHTVVGFDDCVYKLHGLPSSIVQKGKMSVIGNGTVINALKLVEEMETLREQGVDIGEHNLLISGGAHLTLPHHILADKQRESGAGAQGSTGSGIAQVYAAKAERTGIRAESINRDSDELFEVVCGGLRALGLIGAEEIGTAKAYVAAAKKLGPYVTDTALYLNRELSKDTPARVLAEGAQAFLLDNDHGMYPYVTSSPTTSGGVTTGLGIPGKYIDRVIGVAKATQSHVGGGPFVTEILDDPELLERLHGDTGAVDAEYGTTTGRQRRLGHLDLPQIRRANMINGTTEMALTKLDWLSRYGSGIPICVAYVRKGKRLDIAPDAAYKLDQSRPLYATLPTWNEDIQGVRQFEDLPRNAQDYVAFLEKQTSLPITMIGVGPRRDQVIIR